MITRMLSIIMGNTSNKTDSMTPLPKDRNSCNENLRAVVSDERDRGVSFTTYGYYTTD